MSTRALASRTTGLFQPQKRDQVLAELVERSRRRLERLDDRHLEAVLEDALWHERRRLGKRHEDPEETQLDEIARSLVRGTRSDRLDAALRLVSAWGDEIHGRFDPRVYRLATRILPTGLSILLNGAPWRPGNLRPESRLVVKGDLPWLQSLTEEATLILAPTHVSNLDSPLVGLALYLAGLPPFVYGAGLNLFSNKMIGWWMHRLGAYTVDREKKAELYKDVLKDYSIRALTTRHHSLFFPGGTRCRSGEVEAKLKRGLLGTGVVAWQEMLAAQRPDSEIYVVPLTLSYTLVLEASTLIGDHLAESGKQRFIIDDDEFSQPRRVAAFANRVLDLDSAVIAHFGDPIDVLGNPVSKDPAERAQQAERRRRYVCDANGHVQWDAQRDVTYTNRLADALVVEFARYTHLLPTHVVARAAWLCLAESAGTKDPYRVVRAPAEKRKISRERMMKSLREVYAEVRAGAAEGRWYDSELPASEEEALAVALDRFGRYHTTRALVERGGEFMVEDPKLCLYYQNRTTLLDRPKRQRPLGEGAP